MLQNTRTLVLIDKHLFWKISFMLVRALNDRLFLFAMSASVFSLDPRILACCHSFSLVDWIVCSSFSIC